MPVVRCGGHCGRGLGLRRRHGRRYGHMVVPVRTVGTRQQHGQQPDGEEEKERQPDGPAED
ncbi:hypothetical protein [Streptomyces sp. NPDC050355]|uniref:hypothetical protein n=1 Tax=Streptomyces sp. NPDC050355 TaxID=3365609 RepID=UPI0037A83A4D